MATIIRYAGLTERLHRQLIQTTRFISNSYDKVEAREWSGSSCELLVADARDAYGAYIIDIAADDGTPVVAIADDPASIPHRAVRPDTTAARLTRVVAAALSGDTDPRSARQSTLVRLATEPEYHGRDIDASLRSRTVSLRPSSRLVFARTESDLHGLSRQLIRDDWIFRPAAKTDGEGAVSMRLERFFLLGASANQHALPPLPDDGIRLIQQPDVESAQALDYARRVTDALRDGVASPASIAKQTDLTPVEVTSCLWAFLAAGVASPTRAGDARGERPGMLNKLFSRGSEHHSQTGSRDRADQSGAA